ncbi:Positive transcriptional regulator, MutR family [Streptococcus gordonii]|uniref:Positive transcriptional regulator, MutR family n=1 Tax=Streptococcus gordonii TaxID=1302 RepID=A0A139N6G4_STRGN|nr:Positive transcriptional regulator, MutR family [Streptococcus gordonii]RKV74350.1 MAG: Rgg/GadR/MutR family transcriptional regulator [Streptococcus sp.]
MVKKFGEIYKLYREAKKITLRDIEHKGISRSQLSRFEKGETDLTTSKFLLALEQINVPIEEFMYAANDYKRDRFYQIVDEVKQCFLNRNVTRLHKLLIERIENSNSSTFSEMEIIFLKIKLQELSNKEYFNDTDIKKITDYLFSVDFWGMFEILLFGNIMYIFNHETFLLLSKEMLHRTEFYHDIPSYRRVIASMALNSFIICTERNHLVDAKYFEMQISHFNFDESEIYERLIFRYASSFYEFKKDYTKQSILKMRKVIGFMRAVECEKLAERYEEHLNNILE